MDRKKFLTDLGLAGLGAVVLPVIGFAKVMDEPSNDELLRTTSCTAIPEETAGPYPTPSTVSTSSLVRSDITEGTQTGIPLTLTLTIVNSDKSCAALSGIRVDIWQCNKRGYYSAYDNQPGIDGTQNNIGSTWLRGIQYTDASGNVTFKTIYPGWYSPRATHIHVEVYNGTSLLATTQVCFDDELNTTVNGYYATSGANATTNETDMVFSDSYASETLTTTGDTTNGYTATQTIAISAGSLGVETIEAETGGQFSKLRNYPNPFTDSTAITFDLLQTSDVIVRVMDVTGKLIQTIAKPAMSNSLQNIPLDLNASLPAGSYFYQLQVANNKGVFRQSKEMVKI